MDDYFFNEIKSHPAGGILQRPFARLSIEHSAERQLRLSEDDVRNMVDGGSFQSSIQPKGN